MKEGKYSVMIVEDQQMPKALFSHFVESSEKFYLEVAIENATVADIVCAHTPIDLIIMDVVTENGESGLEAAAIIKKKYNCDKYARMFIYKTRQANWCRRILV